LQQITRTSAIALRNDTADVTNPDLHGSIYKEWQQLFGEIITVVPTSDCIDPNWVQIYHKKKLAHIALQNWVGYMERRLKELRKPFVISNSHDMMKFVSTSKDPTVANDNKTVVSMLDRNNSVKELKQLLLFEGCIYTVTRNNSDGTLCNAQSVILLELPSQDHVASFKPITVYACPAGEPERNRLYYDPPPSAKEVEQEWGWKKVKVSLLQEHYITENHIIAYRKQYPLTHPGASTVSFQAINTSMWNNRYNTSLKYIR